MLTLQYIPYSDIEALPSSKRISKLLNVVKQNKIVLLEGRLRKTEEADLIKKTMEEIDAKFTGVELSVIYPENKDTLALFQRIKKNIINMLLGDRLGMTIIGPAAVIKEIKRDPNKIELLTNEISKKKKGK
ncbi:DUF2073 domain-containing protein [Candidatus Woesearchaeota archaeon]|nr:DUF2073 domain-containing protein [Candidatus Woesearchaeota archaeon]